ncbi:MAG: PHB depolymerase family esterase [Pseudomonadota bacterium]
MGYGVKRPLLPLRTRHQGQERRHLCSYPAGDAAPLPLILALHPGRSSPRGMARLTKLHRLGQEEGFAVLYVAGSGPRKRRLTWNADDNKDEANDVRAIAEATDAFSARFSVDPNRIYLVGFSQGAAMAYRFASEAGGDVAAIAAVSGSFLGHGREKSDDLSVFHLHGDLDESVPLKGGSGRFTRQGRHWLPARQSIKRFTASDETTSYRETGPGLVVEGWIASDRSSEQRLTILEGSGHGWPGQPRRLWQRLMRIPVRQDYQATEEIWNFLKDKRRSSVNR